VVQWCSLLLLLLLLLLLQLQAARVVHIAPRTTYRVSRIRGVAASCAVTNS
jgi:hypothetical protein